MGDLRSPRTTPLTPIRPSTSDRDFCYWRTEFGEKLPINLACDSDFHVNRRVLLHAANLRHETDGFTSPPKEGILWIFLHEKYDGCSCSNPRSWVPETSMLTTRLMLHSCYIYIYKSLVRQFETLLFYVVTNRIEALISRYKFLNAYIEKVYRLLIFWKQSVTEFPKM
jgi:hypothetical protein